MHNPPADAAARRAAPAIVCYRSDQLPAYNAEHFVGPGKHLQKRMK